jgi:hypothetical protein
MVETMVSIRVIPLSGKKEDLFWYVKFLAPSCCNNYWDILLGHEVTLSDADKPVDMATQAGKDKYKKAQELNELAYEEMCL